MRWLLAIAVALSLAPAVVAEETVRFNRDVRPILSQNCFHCHGPDATHREADLRLDTAEGLSQVFRGGDAAKSEAWLRINEEDAELRMPPPSAKKELTSEQIGTLKRWIEQGAKWEGHWAFIPPEKPSLPQVQAADRVANPIDAFLLARLEKDGLSFSGPAEKERLLRRVTFDLTGLPPTIEEIDAFLADESPDAYEKVVDRLFASRHFGERMALAWMDAARYGDSSVFHADGPRDMWAWRDWVIRAYNQNKRFDAFTVEQLAGDLLPEASLHQQIATGFLRNNASTDEGGVIPEEFRVEYAVDRVKTTSMVWLGLTMECSQCHDHKYDPISQTDYYRFYAYFNQAADPGMQTRRGNQAPVVNVYDLEAQEQAESLKSRLKEIEAQMARRSDAVGEEFLVWAKEAAAKSQKEGLIPTDTLVHAPLDGGSADGLKFQLGDATREAKLHGPAGWNDSGHSGGAFAFNGQNFLDLGDAANFERTDSFSYGAWIKPPKNASGAPIARMDDGNAFRGFDLYLSRGRVAAHIIHAWPGDAIKVNTKAGLKPGQWQHVLVTYDGSSKAAGVKIYFDGVEQPWEIEQNNLRGTIRTDKTLYLGRRNPGSPFRGEVDDVRIYGRSLSAQEVQALAGNDPLAPLLAKSPDDWTDQERKALRDHYLRNQDSGYQTLAKEAQAVRDRIAEAEKPVSTVMVMRDVPQPRMTYVLERGHYASPNKEKPVQPGVPGVLPALPEDAPANRLGLARWLVQPDHPLTARVAVNRYWQMLFGTGLVKTSGDFGSQGDWPSHPDLLDWLAVDFVESGWDIKRTLKKMVMSNAYRQSSRVTPELLEQDPENRLLARGPRFRLQGEFIRDNALAASGLLVPKIGGPGVKPYQPAGLWNEVSLSGNVRFVQDHGDNLYRRSMYIYWKRSAPAPSMTIFDAPTREKCTLRRSRTNTPLQALVTLNDPQFVEAARVLATRAIRERQDLPERIVRAYRLATGVRPSDATLAVLQRAYADELRHFQAEPERAKKLLGIGEWKRDEKIDPAEHAAMTIVTSLILNLDETLTRS